MIGGNGQGGVLVSATHFVTGVTVQGNTIGTDAGGTLNLGSAAATTNAAGNAAFNLTLPAGVGAGEKVTATATDPTGNTSEFSAAVAVNHPPTAAAGGPYTVPENGAVTLDASATTDPEQTAASLTYAWDLDGDGVFGETGTAAGRGDEVGRTPTSIRLERQDRGPRVVPVARFPRPRERTGAVPAIPLSPGHPPGAARAGPVGRLAQENACYPAGSIACF